MINTKVLPTIAMTDPSDNDNDIQYVFGRHEWQQEQPQPSKGRTTRKKQAVAANKEIRDPKSKQGSVDDQEKGNQTMVFPVKLHRLLESDDAESAAVVSWQPHGRAFLVHNKEAFVQKFLPSYFRQSKWASFQRQLNIYGFQRLTAGRDRGAYYHDLFLRGHPELAPRIHRMKLKGIGQGRHRTNAELEPNFYRMPPAGAGDNIDMQPTASEAIAGTGPASSPHPTQGISTINVLQLFGGGGSGMTDQSQSLASNIALGDNSPDLNNLFFLTNGNEITSLQNMGGAQMNGGNGTRVLRESFDPQHEGVQSGQHLSLLANLFNAAKNNNNGNNNAAEPSAQLNYPGRRNNNGADDDKSDELNQWSTSGFVANNNLSYPSTFQNTDSNPLSTTSLMHYMSTDNNVTDERPAGHSQSDAAFSDMAGTMAPRSSQQSPWAAGLATAGFSSGPSHQPTSFTMRQADHSHSAGLAGDQGNLLSGGNSNSDPLNTFGFDGPRMRRMSAAAMSTLLTSASNNGNNGNNFGNAFDSNSNLLLFSNLNRSRNSSSNLMETTQTDPTSTLTTVQALNMLGTSHSSPNSTNPASHQLALLNAASPGQSSSTNNGQSGFNFADLLSTRAAASQPTFLDSVYEPIPIKEDGHADATVAGNVNGQQRKLSAIAAARRGSGRGGFLQLHPDRL